MMRFIGVLCVIGSGLCLSCGAEAGPTFSVSFDASVRSEPATGRLVVYLIREGAHAGAKPSEGPFWDDPQPMFGVDVAGLAPGAAAVLDDSATSFPDVLSRLPAGRYRAQAVLDVHRRDSDWKREPGNLVGDVVSFALPAANPVALKLVRAVEARPLPEIATVELFETRSALLSEFHGRDIVLRAGVAFPINRDPSREYAAVYEVPGFGGDFTGAYEHAPGLQGVEDDLRRQSFWITLDPESGNGHTLFADSANNGPWGRALVEELIPALEARYKLLAQPSARLLRGHSSGGWSTIWLAITYPGTFGACWSTSPDGVDFRKMQRCDIYNGQNMYTTGAGRDTPSFRQGGRVSMTVRQENLMEEVLGPDNTSGQQWDSWFAVYGPRNAAGNPAALFDPVTGVIDRAVAEQYRAYDIGERLRQEPDVIGPILLQRVRLVVGDQDNFYLNEAVALLQAEAARLKITDFPEGRNGYIKIIPGLDHGSIMGAPDVQRFPAEMLSYLRRAGHTNERK